MNIKKHKEQIINYFRDRGLTKKESLVAFGVVQGKTNAEIGESYRMKTKTVKYHITNILGKFNIANRGRVILQLPFVLVWGQKNDKKYTYAF